MGRQAQGPEDLGKGVPPGAERRRPCYLHLRAGGPGRSGVTGREEAKSERGWREPAAPWGPRRSACESAAAKASAGQEGGRGGGGGLRSARWADERLAGGGTHRVAGAGWEASGRAAGRREPLTCAAEEAELQQPMAGPEKPGGGAGRAATPRSPSACEPASARGGRGLALHGLAAAAARAAVGTQEAARLGAGAGHIPRRRRRRLRGSRSAPAAVAAPQRKGAGGGGGSPSPRPPPPASRAQSLSRSLTRADASSAPRSSPIRLPAPSAARRRAGGSSTAAKTRPGPSTRVGVCAVPNLFSGGTEADC